MGLFNYSQASQSRVNTGVCLRPHEPAVFLTALLNSQPMGFYTPSQLLQDAERRGVQVLPVNVTVLNAGAGQHERIAADTRRTLLSAFADGAAVGLRVSGICGHC